MNDFEATVQFYKDALESARQGLWDYNTETGEKYHSQTWREIRGLKSGASEAINDEEWFETIHPADRPLARQQTYLLNTGQINEVSYEYRERHAEGHWIWIMCRGRAIAWDEGGSPIRFVGTDTDITQIKKSDEELLHTQSKLQLVLSSIDAGVWEYRISDQSIYWDDRQRTIYGLPSDGSELPLDVWESAIHPDDRAATIATADDALINKSDYSLSYRIIRKDGKVRFLKSYISFLYRSSDNIVLVGLDLDVTEEQERADALLNTNKLLELKNQELEAARAEMEHNALHDALTGLPNRRFLEKFQSEVVKNNEMSNVHSAIMLLDLDRFKQINDVLGHGAGDYVLCQMADVLRRTQISGSFSARVGGDEFAVFFPSSPGHKVLTELAKNLIKTMSHPIKYEGFDCRVGLSIGIASADNYDTDKNQLFRNADLALYNAKSLGRDRLSFYQPYLMYQAEETKRLADELLSAIENSQFICAYQPQFDSKSGEISGIEALARWSRPDKTIVMPGEFLPVAEKLNLVSHIDHLIFQKAICDLKDWESRGLIVPRLSINLSKSRLVDPSFIEQLQLSGLNYSNLCFELLESSFLENDDKLVEASLESLRRLNISIEVDDFGTGHASILSLLRIKPDRLKIDRAFIGNLGRTDQQTRLVKSIIEIGHLLEMKIIAEGVETHHQRKILVDLGCDYMQGYFLARPMLNHELIRFLQVNAKKVSDHSNNYHDSH